MRKSAAEIGAKARLIQSFNMVSVLADALPWSAGRDVEHHGLHASADRLNVGQPQQVHRCHAQRGHGSGSVALISMGGLIEPGVEDPCKPSMLQRSRTRRSIASVVISSLVTIKCEAWNGLESQLPAAATDADLNQSADTLRPLRSALFLSLI